MRTQTQIAIRAANMRHQIGRDAARRYIINQGVSLRLYYLACTLHAAQ